MAKTKNDNLQGTLALLVLKTLEQGPMHGWGITLHIQRTSVKFQQRYVKSHRNLTC
jgi:DNA-binding PadR family transcriptional regulator